MNSLFRRSSQIIGLLTVIIVLIVFFSWKEQRFLSLDTVGQIFKYYSPMAMLALGMTFIILTGGIDLSVGFGMMLVAFVMAGLVRDRPEFAMPLVLCCGLGAALLLGASIGGSIAFLRIPPFIVSLAGMVGAYGLTLIISRNESISDLPPALLWLGGTEFNLFGAGFPIMLLVVITAYLLSAVMLSRTQLGRYIYAIGSNREAARLSGVRVPLVELTVYSLSAICVWIAAWMQIGINRTADPKVALSDNLELNAIAVVVIGGTSLSGGRGTILGTALGATLLALIFYGLPFINYSDPSHKKMILGGIIFLSALLDAFQRRYSRA
jgi:ribose/xylose/arabinose/galactoside ABC-type transport system permease subunit